MREVDTFLGPAPPQSSPASMNAKQACRIGRSPRRTPQQWGYHPSGNLLRGEDLLAYRWWLLLAYSRLHTRFWLGTEARVTLVSRYLNRYKLRHLIRSAWISKIPTQRDKRALDYPACVLSLLGEWYASVSVELVTLQHVQETRAHRRREE